MRWFGENQPVVSETYNHELIFMIGTTSLSNQNRGLVSIDLGLSNQMVNRDQYEQKFVLCPGATSSTQRRVPSSAPSGASPRLQAGSQAGRETGVQGNPKTGKNLLFGKKPAAITLQVTLLMVLIQFHFI